MCDGLPCRTIPLRSVAEDEPVLVSINPLAMLLVSTADMQIEASVPVSSQPNWMCSRDVSLTIRFDRSKEILLLCLPIECGSISDCITRCRGVILADTVANGWGAELHVGCCSYANNFGCPDTYSNFSQSHMNRATVGHIHCLWWWFACLWMSPSISIMWPCDYLIDLAEDSMQK